MACITTYLCKEYEKKIMQIASTSNIMEYLLNLDLLTSYELEEMIN